MRTTSNIVIEVPEGSTFPALIATGCARCEALDTLGERA